MPRRRFDEDTLKRLVAAYGRFVDENEYPLEATFTAKNPLARQHALTKQEIADLSEFKRFYNLALAKQESYLVENMLMNPGKAISSLFLLKQPKLGYTDKITTDITTGGEKIKFASDVPRPSLSPSKVVKRTLKLSKG